MVYLWTRRQRWKRCIRKKLFETEDVFLKFALCITLWHPLLVSSASSDALFLLLSVWFVWEMIFHFGIGVFGVCFDAGIVVVVVVFRGVNLKCRCKCDVGVDILVYKKICSDIN